MVVRARKWAGAGAAAVIGQRRKHLCRDLMAHEVGDGLVDRA